jgi:hypothetical protein
VVEHKAHGPRHLALGIAQGDAGDHQGAVVDLQDVQQDRRRLGQPQQGGVLVLNPEDARLPVHGDGPLAGGLEELKQEAHDLTGDGLVVMGGRGRGGHPGRFRKRQRQGRAKRRGSVADGNLPAGAGAGCDMPRGIKGPQRRLFLSEGCTDGGKG